LDLEFFSNQGDNLIILCTLKVENTLAFRANGVGSDMIYREKFNFGTGHVWLRE
jgi:hypothetical protein